ncbi:MAG: S8/S53 family peptidase [Bdellovibrionales bacterium]
MAQEASTVQFVEDVPEISYTTPAGPLSDFWVDEVTGIDLVEEERFQLHKNPQFEWDQPSVVACDTKTRNHNDYVQRLVDGKYRINPSKYISCYRINNFEENLIEPPEKNPNDNYIMNVSMYWTDADLDVESLDAVDKKWILVKSAGNGYNKIGEPDTLTDISEKLALHGAFVVGSIGPDAISTEYSQEGPLVTILAPSGDKQSTVCEPGRQNCTSFGGTSAATPKVTYTLSAVRELLPAITRNQLRQLLIGTAIPSIHNFEIPQGNGYGVLNAYKMWRIALLVREKCGLQTVSPSSCYENEIFNLSNYAFPEASIDSNRIQRAFPGCGELTQEHDAVVSNSEKKSVFDQVRRIYFLNYDRKDLKRALSCIYESAGLGGNAFYFQQLDPGPRVVVDRSKIHSFKALRFVDKQNVFNEQVDLLMSRSDDSNYLQAVVDEAMRHPVWFMKSIFEKQGKVGNYSLNTFRSRSIMNYRVSKFSHSQLIEIFDFVEREHPSSFCSDRLMSSISFKIAELLGENYLNRLRLVVESPTSRGCGSLRELLSESN